MSLFLFIAYYSSLFLSSFFCVVFFFLVLERLRFEISFERLSVPLLAFSACVGLLGIVFVSSPWGLPDDPSASDVWYKQLHECLVGWLAGWLMEKE